MVPDPVPAAVETRTTSLSLHTVWFALIVPAVTAFCTVILIAAVGADSQTLAPSVDRPTLLNQVVVVKAAGL
ncbi:hypothetical protein D3C86_1018760 [compost metagenome]